MQNQLQSDQSISIQNESQFDYSTNTVSPRSQTNNCDNVSDSSETEEALSELSSSEKEDFYSTELVSNKYLALRASTAPARPLSDIEEFRRSSDFLLLEHTVICASQLIRTEDMKYDLDSDEGQIACKKLLNQIERLCDVFKVPCMSRSYRKGFSNAYRVLYKEGSLCYLTEILDSAQEGFPYLYVNGEKYLFSNEVLEAGNKLYSSFSKIQNSFRDIYNRICDETSPGVVGEIIDSLKKVLQDFDADWVEFEHLYVHELMVIETDARRFITESIEIERELTVFETREKSKGKLIFESDEYNHCRERLVTMIGKINSVANIEGKGRDDLTLDILLAAEGITRRMSSSQSSPLKSLADKIKNSFSSFRSLLQKYEVNIEVVDPQLKNNSDLVEVLVKFEESWERGKTYILNTKRYNRVVYVHSLIEKTAEKYELFKQQLEYSDSELFVTIPGLIVLHALEDDRGICRYFCSPMYDETDEIGIVWKRLKRSYKLGKLASSSTVEYTELIEMMIIGVPIPQPQRSQIINPKFDNLDHVVNKTKNLAMALQRHRPTEWNKFLDIVLL
ncbi:unnamed protein product [Blepharisma stoltei]|uniref:Uncharacterized protein n=1 Tax=Blepharisma stoltei TaxID=1481888 RepID=A0AAU9K7Y4_9CILI|nr:unnamed protein product [Blepharisma stoltei]